MVGLIEKGGISKRGFENYHIFKNFFRKEFTAAFMQYGGGRTERRREMMHIELYRKNKCLII